MGPVDVEAKHTPWEAASSIWGLLEGSRLLEKGLVILHKHRTPMSTRALSEAE